MSRGEDGVSGTQKVGMNVASFPDFLQMTEQRKQKQRIGLLGHPQHMNVNPQQPA